MAYFIISLFLLSHVITDFYLQNQEMADKKKKVNNDKIIAFHALHFFLCTFLITGIFFGFTLLPYILALSTVHFLIDKGKSYFDRLENNFLAVVVFLLDQLIHVAFILLLYPQFNKLTFSHLFNNIFQTLLRAYPLPDNPNVWAYSMILISAYLFVINGGTVLTKLIIKTPYPAGKNEFDFARARIVLKVSDQQAAALEDGASNNDLSQIIRYGQVIGILERIIILTSIIVNKYEIIAVVVAVKSIARFKELDNRTNDYYIIGTMASYGAAFFVGIGLNILSKFLNT